MSMTDLQMVLDNIRPSFEYNMGFVKEFLVGKGLDMGCGNCPLLVPDCIHVDISPQPIAQLQVVPTSVIQTDAAVLKGGKDQFDFVFSSHMVEDLPTREAMIDCLVNWSLSFLKRGGHLVLLIPDMEGGRYPKAEEGGNPSHRINVGRKYIEEMEKELLKKGNLTLIQIDTIPHDRSCTMDAVFMRVG